MPKPMTISTTGGDSTVRITIGNEEAVLTAVEVSEAICRLVALRAEMTPRFGPDPLVGDAPQFSHSTGMRWWLGCENNGERDVQLFTLHPGLGWLSQRFDLGQAQYFLDSVHRLLLIKPKKQS